jgi:hypothetical protein
MGWQSGNNDRTIQKVFLGKPDEKRKARRPKLRGLDCIENDLKLMGVKRWRKKPEDRSVWAIILKEALVKLKGPYAYHHHQEKEEEEGEGQEGGRGGGGRGGGELSWSTTQVFYIVLIFTLKKTEEISAICKDLFLC